MAMSPQGIMRADGPRSGRQLWAFGFFCLAVPLLILAGWLAMRRIDRLLHWSRADAEVRRADVYLATPGRTSRRNILWGAYVTLRYVVNGRVVETSVDRGFQSGVRGWMEHWARHYPAGSHRKVLFDPASPTEADLEGEWSLASFAWPIGSTLAAGLFLWGWRRLAGAAPSS
jgi:Protein of unknown function (DUF3592)